MSQLDTYADYLAWCKRRALEYVDAGDLKQAYASFGSDMSKYPDTKDHAAIQLGLALMMSGHLDTQAKMREFIEGVN